MSLLHPNEDDREFEQGYSDAGFRMALNRAWRLTELLKRTRRHVPAKLRTEIDGQISKTHYDETDDGTWRLESSRQLPPQKTENDLDGLPLGAKNLEELRHKIDEADFRTKRVDR